MILHLHPYLLGICRCMIMEKIPFNKMNYLLVNCKRKIWEVNHGMTISFFEYVKSQMHYPLIPYVQDRDLEIYKKVYLHLVGKGRCNKDLIEKVLRYFYFDIYSCLVNTNQQGEDFNLDLSCLESIFPKHYLDEKVSLNEKTLELLKAHQADSIYLLWG